MLLNHPDTRRTFWYNHFVYYDIKVCSYQSVFFSPTHPMHQLCHSWLGTHGLCVCWIWLCEFRWWLKLWFEVRTQEQEVISVIFHQSLSFFLSSLGKAQTFCSWWNIFNSQICVCLCQCWGVATLHVAKLLVQLHFPVVVELLSKSCYQAIFSTSSRVLWQIQELIL